MSVFRQNAVLPLAVYISFARFSPTAMPCRTSNATNTGFSVCYLPQLMLPVCVLGSFLQTASGKNVAGLGHGTVVCAEFF